MCPFVSLTQALFANATQALSILPAFPVLYTLTYNDLPIIFSLFIGINIILYGIEYLVMHIFPSPEGTAFIRNERNELIRTIVIVASFFTVAYILSIISYGILTTANPGIQSITHQPSIIPSFNFNGQNINGGGWYDGHIRLAFYSVKSLVVMLKSIYLNFFTLEFVIGFLSTISIPATPTLNIGIAMMSFSIMPFEGLALIATAHTSIVDLVTYLIGFVYGKLYVIFFSWKAVPFLLMPLGVLLRSVYLTRKTGSTIIAISLVLYFILPLAVLFSDFLIYNIYQPRVYLISLSPGVIKGDTSIANSDIDSPIYKLQNNLDTKNARANNLESDLNSDINKKVKKEAGGSWFEKLLRKIPLVGNLFLSTWDTVKSTPSFFINFFKGIGSIVSTMYNIMSPSNNPRGFMGFFEDLFTPMFYGDVVYPYLINEVVEVSQFAALILFTTILEIIITVTAYKNLSEFIGGESKILGLSKII